MALTHWNEVGLGETGNYDPLETLYYPADKNIVLSQAGAVVGGYLNGVFRGEDVTVFAAKDSLGNVLQKVALPCPPYYHNTMPEAQAMKYLANT